MGVLHFSIANLLLMLRINKASLIHKLTSTIDGPSVLCLIVVEVVSMHGVCCHAWTPRRGEPDLPSSHWPRFPSDGMNQSEVSPIKCAVSEYAVRMTFSQESEIRKLNFKNISMSCVRKCRSNGRFSNNTFYRSDIRPHISQSTSTRSHLGLRKEGLRHANKK